MKHVLALTALLASPALALAQDETSTVAQGTQPAGARVESVASPDGSISVALTTDGDGRALYSITRGGKPIIAPSRLGFLFTDARKIERNLKIDSAQRTSRDETWEQPWGEWRTIRSKHNELRVRLMETTSTLR